MTMLQVEERGIRIEVKEHRDTHLLVAMSDDLPGFVVAARSEDQLRREIPAALKEFLEAQGNTVLSVTADSAKEMPGDFIQRTIAAHAKLSHAS